ncbi:MAG: hypothetical protein P4L67_00750 [Candidatus Pacebacteria bacterium]|nr:hypothetical protein [Candidatus Paceibacterota bacterium]
MSAKAGPPGLLQQTKKLLEKVRIMEDEVAISGYTVKVNVNKEQEQLEKPSPAREEGEAMSEDDSLEAFGPVSEGDYDISPVLEREDFSENGP